MKSVAVLPGSKELRMVDHPEPSLNSPTQVLIRMVEIGLCGTDREIAAFQYGTPPPGSDYLVIGHESLGRVVEAGPEVTRIKRGDLVVLMVRRPCPHPECPACLSGRPDFCYTGDFTERGIKEAHGYLTEQVVEEERFLNVVPERLREVGVLAEPLTIAEKALDQMWKVQSRLPWLSESEGNPRPGGGRRAVVLGAGPVGLLGALILTKSGFDTTVYSRSSGPHDKAGLVASFGARFVAAEDHSVQSLAETVGNIDLVYEASGASRASFDLMTVLGTNGVFVFTGVPGRRAPIELDADLIMRDLVLKNQVVLGTVNAPREAYEAAIRDLDAFQNRWPEALRRLITGRFPLEDAPRLLQGDAGGIKNVISIE